MSNRWDKIKDAKNRLGKCLVIGGSGFLGKKLALQLHRAGVQVKTFSRHIPKELEPLGISCLAGDIRHEQEITEAMRGMDTVFHTASCCGMWGKREMFYDINCRGTEIILQAARDNRIQRLVYTSTPSVVVGNSDIKNGDESLPYLRHSQYSAYYPQTKQIAEKMILDFNGDSGIRTMALRPHLIWGHDDPHILPLLRTMAQQGHLRQIGDGSNIVSITHIANAVYAHIMAACELSSPASRCIGQTYFISDASPVRLWNWINEYLRRIHCLQPQGKISRWFAYGIASLEEIIHSLLPCLGQPGMTRFIVGQLTQNHHFSWQKAHRDFGYTPIVSNEEGLQETVENTQLIWE